MPDDKARLLHSLEIDRRPTVARGVPWWLLLVAVAAGAGMVGGFRLIMPDQPARPSEAIATPTSVASGAPAPVNTAATLIPKHAEGLVASGYVVARRKATVAAEITGKVTEVFIEEGMVVTVGQPLARLQSDLAEHDLRLSSSRVVSAEAGVASVAAELVDADKTLERTRALSRQDYASRADLIKAESRANLLRADLNKAKADLQTARLEVKRNEDSVSKYVIPAPFAGVVVDKSAQPGEMISPLSAGGGFTRTGICTIVDMDSIEIEVDVNEAFIGRVHAQQRVEAVLDAYPEWTIPASVIAIVPTANRDKATVKTRIAFAAKDPRILPDMAVR